MIDPVFPLALRVALALLFAGAAVHKLREHEAFRAALAEYALLPRAALAPVSALLPGLELASVVALIVWPSAGAAGIATLLLLYAGAMAVNVARGRRDLDCGCGGPAGGQRVGPGLVLRNVVLAALALAIALPVRERALGAVDAVTVLGLVSTFAASWAATQHLAALPHLARAGGR